MIKDTLHNYYKSNHNGGGQKPIMHSGLKHQLDNILTTWSSSFVLKI